MPYDWLIVLNKARAEVATAYARARARYAQIGTNERAIRSGRAGFQQDLLRTRNQQGLPIETLDILLVRDPKSGLDDSQMTLDELLA